MNRDGKNESLWQQTVPDFPQQGNIDNNAVYDVVVAGAGITGINTALILQQGGKKVLIAEAANIGFGTSGGTTAHINNIFDSSYDQVIKAFGTDNAKLFADAGRESMQFIKEQVETHRIDCEYEQKTAFLFALDDKQVKMLEKVVEGTNEVGIPINFVEHSPFPIPYLKLASVLHQAQFNPMKYLIALAEVFVNAGGTITENCRVQSVDEGDIHEIKTSKGIVKAYNLVYATHVPPGVNILHFRNAPYRSYALAVKLKDDNYPQALGYDLSDPYHYYRSQKIDGEEFLIAGGEDHKTGHEENTDQCFRNLESYIRKYFEVESIAYRWSSQYFVPTDGLPYIGHLPGNRDNVFTATGFNGNGIPLGTISGKIIADVILTGESKYKDLFSPSRVKPVAGFVDFVKFLQTGNAHGILSKISIDVLVEF
jgi:glycine/D-amino acid oxidase-like deaminating enzyme